jgi:RNA polymerase sigma-70 factor (ECF subfamily)
VRADGVLDREEVQTVRDDDEAALRILHDEHAGALLSYALRLARGDRQRAEDIVQETLLRAWSHLDATRNDRPVRPWLFTIARNVAVDEHRARKARPIEVGDDSLEVVGVDDEIDRALEAWLVTDAVSSLSEAHRHVLVETYYRGRTVDEAASVLGIPPGTVKSRTFYALKALRLAFQERGVEL